VMHAAFCLCSLDRARMKEETHRDPVGDDAPTDLAGTTPLGYATYKNKRRPTPSMEAILFSPGDKSVLPKTPHSLRVGKSPWKVPGCTDNRENLVYALR
jgi:hypothetical protein